MQVIRTLCEGVD